MTTSMHPPAKKTDPRKAKTEVSPAKVAAAGQKMAKKDKSCGGCA